MNYGLYISASGALTSMHRQDVWTNNLANINTAGFKPDIPSTRQRDPARIEKGLMMLPSNALLERLGGGVHLMPSRTAFPQGALESTGNPLDVAIRGEGFFAVMDRDGDGQAATRLTRDGRFTRDGQGRLILASGGQPVLDDRGRPILAPIEQGQVQFSEDGTVHVGGQPVARLGLVSPDSAALRKHGDGLFAIDPDDLRSSRRGGGDVLAGHVEQSAINEITAMMQMTAASRAVAGNMGMIQYHDRLMEGAINRLGRVA